MRPATPSLRTVLSVLIPVTGVGLLVGYILPGLGAGYRCRPPCDIQTTTQIIENALTIAIVGAVIFAIIIYAHGEYIHTTDE